MADLPKEVFDRLPEDRQKQLEARKHLSHPVVQDFDKIWAKDRSDEGVLKVLADWFYDRGIDPVPIIAELKHVDDNRIRREQMEEVTREHGNLETEPMLIQSLTEDPPSSPRVEVIVEGRQGGVDYGQALVTVEVPAEHAAHIISVKHREERGDPNAPPGSYAREPVWHLFSYGDSFPFEIDPASVIRRAVAQLGDRQTPWVGVEGELFYPTGAPSEEWLVLEYAPEYLQSELEREYGDNGMITLYTDGGGYGSEADPAFVDLKTGELYQLIYQGSHSGEVECPFKDYDHWNQEDERNRDVNDEDTLWGEHPHKECRFCGTNIGEKHGHVYVGEGAENVYMRVVDEEDEER